MNAPVIALRGPVAGFRAGRWGYTKGWGPSGAQPTIYQMPTRHGDEAIANPREGWVRAHGGRVAKARGSGSSNAAQRQKRGDL